MLHLLSFTVTQWVRNPPGKQETRKDVNLIASLGRSPGGGLGNPLQYPCLENPMDRGAWWVTVHQVTKSRTQLKWMSTSTHPGRGVRWSYSVQGGRERVILLYGLVTKILKIKGFIIKEELRTMVNT